VISKRNHKLKLVFPFPNYVSFSSELEPTSTPDCSISLIYLQVVLSTKWIFHWSTWAKENSWQM